MVRRAAIDVGTNSVRLLVADVFDAPAPAPRLRPVLRHLTITRLGEGLTPGGRLRSTAIARTADAVHRYLALARDAGASHPALVGTHAVRTAQNPDALLSRLRRPLRILSGDEEAHLGYEGVLAGLASRARPERLLVVDIGGGSVELTWGRGDRIAAALSVPCGAVVLTERFLAHDPPRPAEIAALRAHLDRIVAPRLRAGSRVLGVGAGPLGPAGRRRPPRVLGVGGTITTMAAIVQRLSPYDPDRVHGFRLSHRAVARTVDALAAMPLAARRRLPGLQPERADIIVAGALVLEHVLAKTGAPGITVSEADLLWALVLDQAPVASTSGTRRARGRVDRG